jgi:hypothetical protein
MRLRFAQVLAQTGDVFAQLVGFGAASGQFLQFRLELADHVQQALVVERWGLHGLAHGFSFGDGPAPS